MNDENYKIDYNEKDKLRDIIKILKEEWFKDLKINDFDKFKNENILATFNGQSFDFDELISKRCKSGDTVLIHTRLNQKKNSPEYITYDK